MRPFILTLAALIVLNLVTPAGTPAQSTTIKGSEQTVADAQKDAEAAAKEAQKQAETAARDAQNKAEQAQKEAEAAQEAAARTVHQQEEREAMILPSTGVGPDSFLLGLSSYATQTILVIPVDQIKQEDLAAITEDLGVLSRIFDKKLAQSHLISGNFLSSRGRLSMALSRNSSPIEAMYVQGYGALFFTKINFPLSPPPQAQEEKETKKEGVDPVWEQMKREMYTPQEAARRSTDDRPKEKYDAEKVKELKETLIKTLKHATNIRGLKPDESVILTVIGKGSQSDSLVTRVQVNIDGHNRYITTEPAGAGTGSLSPTVITIRAKKADIDAFAKDQLSFDQFTEKTQLISYPYLGENLGTSSSPSSRSRRSESRSGRGLY